MPRPGNFDVRLGRCRIAGRVVVGLDDCRGAQFQGPFDDIAWVDDQYSHINDLALLKAIRIA